MSMVGGVVAEETAALRDLSMRSDQMVLGQAEEAEKHFESKEHCQVEIDGWVEKIGD